MHMATLLCEGGDGEEFQAVLFCLSTPQQLNNSHHTASKVFIVRAFGYVKMGHSRQTLTGALR